MAISRIELCFKRIVFRRSGARTDAAQIAVEVVEYVGGPGYSFIELYPVDSIQLIESQIKTHDCLGKIFEFRGFHHRNGR